MGRLFLIRAVTLDARHKQAHQLLARYYEDQASKAKEIPQQKQMQEKAALHRKQLEQLSVTYP
jgi:hypothetical protein